MASPIGSVAVLALVILVHEAGHFLAARSFGMSVDEFSVGVGPRILGVRRREVDGRYVYERIVADDDGTAMAAAGDAAVKDGIEFSLRAIPLGGYVRFPENYNRTLAFEQEDAARKARDQARLMRVEEASAAEKFLESIAAKSFAFNVLSLGLLKRWQSKREEEQLRRVELEAEMESLSARKSIGAGSWWKVLPWVSKKDHEEEEKGSSGAGDQLAILQAAKAPEIEYFDDPNLLQNRSGFQRAVVLSGGVIFNLLLAFACYFGEVSFGNGMPTPVFDTGAVVSSMPSKDSPSLGVLKQGDVILGVNDMTTPTGQSGGIWSSQKQISSIIGTIRETPEGESVKLTILHGRGDGKTDTVSVVPKRNTDGQASIGVMLGPNYERTDMVRATSIFDGAAKAAAAVYNLTSETARSILGLLIGLLFGNGLPAGTSMSGPIGVLKSGADVVSTSDLAAVVAFAASISINLAVVNALPLPALDGGQLVFVLAEAAAGRRIDQRVQEGINAGALFILFMISVGTTVGDVTSLFR